MKMSLLFLISLSFVAGCASVTSGNDQSLSVATAPEVAAQCQLSNDAGTWFVPTTPGSVMVERDASDMTVICRKGAMSGTARVASETKALAFGNILAGGIIGAAVDRGTGAAFDYPALITVPVQKGGLETDLRPKPAAQAPSAPATRKR